MKGSEPIHALCESLFMREMLPWLAKEVIPIPRRLTQTERHERKVEKRQGDTNERRRTDRRDRQRKRALGRE